MVIVNIHAAKTNLSRLIEQAAKGEPFIIAKAGKPMVKVTAIDVSRHPKKQRLGFLNDDVSVPGDFNEMGRAEIEKLFGGSE